MTCTGDDVVLDADSFLIKGEILDSHMGWCGNPTKLARRHVGSGRGLRTSSTPPSETNPSHKPASSIFALRRGRHFCAISANNWGAVVELELGAGQEDLVESNLYSVAEAQFDRDVRRAES
jgi:hypothetical protein